MHIEYSCHRNSLKRRILKRHTCHKAILQKKKKCYRPNRFAERTVRIN